MNVDCLNDVHKLIQVVPPHTFYEKTVNCITHDSQLIFLIKRINFIIRKTEYLFQLYYEHGLVLAD